MSRKKNSDLEKAVLIKVVRISAKVNGVVVGTFLGLAIFIATNWLILKGGDRVGPHLALLGQFFIGYRVTFVGSLIGFAYGFLFGFALGYIIATLYNWIVAIKQPPAN
ncbi:MAG: hypothetical protein L0Y67_06270 [Gammaproteobacteria bacterium]|nr:hypothetical protein [Gammaproteobacteria bacterium]